MRIASHAYLINIVARLTGDPVMIEKVRDSKAISIMNNTKVLGITGDKMVKMIKVECFFKSGKTETL